MIGYYVKMEFLNYINTKKIYKILARYGGRDLVGKNNELSTDIFWSSEK